MQDSDYLGSSGGTAESLAEAELPELPEPEIGIWGAPDSEEAGQIVRRLYSHYQMREYAVKAKELAREEILDTIERMMPSGERSVNWTETEDAAWNILSALSERIRSDA